MLIYHLFYKIFILCGYPASFHAPKKWSEASDTNPMPWPLSVLYLRADFHSVAECEYHPAVRIDRCEVTSLWNSFSLKSTNISAVSLSPAINSLKISYWISFFSRSFSRLSSRLSRAAYPLYFMW